MNDDIDICNLKGIKLFTEQKLRNNKVNICY